MFVLRNAPWDDTIRIWEVVSHCEHSFLFLEFLVSQVNAAAAQRFCQIMTALTVTVEVALWSAILHHICMQSISICYRRR